MKDYLQIICILIVVAATAALAKPPIVNRVAHVVDDNELETIAKIVCDTTKGEEWQISRVSTVIKLATFFENLPVDHKLSSCRYKYLDTYKELGKVIDTRNDDVCSAEKINRIIEFHQKFVSKLLFDKKIQEINKLEAPPRMLTLFYLNYAYQVSLTCKRSIIEQLDSAESKEIELRLVDKREELKELDQIIKEFSSSLGLKSSLSFKYLDDITSHWTALYGSDSNYYYEPTDENNNTRANFATGEFEKLRQTQLECLNFKRLYEDPMLASMRLIDYGYYLDDEPFARELLRRPHLRRLIGLVIICETLLPMRLIKDETLKPGQLVLMSIEKAKLSPYEPKGDLGPINELPINRQNLNHNSWANKPDIVLNSVNPMKAIPTVDGLMANIKDRERFFEPFLKELANKIKFKIKSSLRTPSKSSQDLVQPIAAQLFSLLA